jgi:predicted dinucleotide-binding enzyme
MSTTPAIGIIGSGPMGRGFATLLARAGYTVTLGTRRPAAPELDELPDTVQIGSFREAAETGDVVFIAIVHAATRDLLTDLAPVLAGKTLISSNNAWIPEHYEAAGLSSAVTEGSWTAAIVPDTHVVRAFTHIDWQYLVPKSSQPPTYAVSYAVDDADTDTIAVRLITDMGFAPYRIGTLAESAPLDVDGALWHYLFTPGQMRTTLAGTLTYSAGPYPPKLPDDASAATLAAAIRHSAPRDTALP